MADSAQKPVRADQQKVFRLVLTYDGSSYLGWQIQKQGRTVQEVLELALHCVTQQDLRVVASGRTDAGVHALGQVVSVSLSTALAPQVLAQALNANLPNDVRVVGAQQVDASFDALRDATGKHYRYWLQHGTPQHVLRRAYCAYLPDQLDTEAMQRGAQLLVGTHDFASFQAAGSPRQSTIRTVRRLDLCEEIVEHDTEQPYRFVRLDIAADGFLYNMVRNIAGTLFVVGRRQQPPQWIETVLEARDRRRAGPTAPPQGLCLMSVEYERCGR